MDRLNRVLVSGYGKDGSFPSWPKRYGIIVLKDEGYARKITFLPGWLDQKELPVGYEHLTNLVVNASPPMKVQTPLLIPEAVQPGKPILFDKLHGVMVPGDRLVPFKANFYSQEPEKKPADSTGLSLEIEIWNPVEAGKDITAVYLVGNNGPGSVWVWQNALVPAHATWEVHRSDKKAISTISGEALQVLADLLPERPPIPLNPGEYLTFRRILPASKLPLKRREKYTLTLAIDAQWFPTPPESKDQAQVTQLATTLEIQPQ